MYNFLILFGCKGKIFKKNCQEKCRFFDFPLVFCIKNTTFAGIINELIIGNRNWKKK